LGLHLVTNLVNQLEGTIKVGSERGAAFRIAFPEA
jgi:two-component sensor histidine kinase